MTPIRIHTRIQWYLILLVALALAGCGGGGGSDPAVATVSNDNRAATQNTFTATLTGAQSLPATASQAIGSGTAILDPTARLLRLTVTTAGIAGIAVTVQEGSKDTAGRVAFSLIETAPGSGIWSAVAALTDAQIAALSAGNFFFNVASTANPAGEIRGQLLPQLSTPGLIGAQGAGTTAAGTPAAVSFRNALTGGQAVPPVNTTATGLVTASIDDATKTLALAVTVTGIAATEAHLHEGAPGANGPIVLRLSETVPGSGIWVAQTRLNTAQFNALLVGKYYVDAVSAATPGMELRGQIAELQRLSHINDCRYGGFGFDGCVADGFGLFIGYGLAGYPFGAGYGYPYGASYGYPYGPGYGAGYDYGIADPGGFGGVEVDYGGFGFGGGFDGGGGADTPAPGIVF